MGRGGVFLCGGEGGGGVGLRGWYSSVFESNIAELIIFLCLDDDKRVLLRLTAECQLIPKFNTCNAIIQNYCFLPNMTDILKHVQCTHIYMQIANKTQEAFLNVPKSYVFSPCHELCDPGFIHWRAAGLIIFYHPLFISVWHRGNREF